MARGRRDPRGARPHNDIRHQTDRLAQRRVPGRRGRPVLRRRCRALSPADLRHPPVRRPVRPSATSRRRASSSRTAPTPTGRWESSGSAWAAASPCWRRPAASTRRRPTTAHCRRTPPRFSSGACPVVASYGGRRRRTMRHAAAKLETALTDCRCRARRQGVPGRRTLLHEPASDRPVRSVHPAREGRRAPLRPSRPPRTHGHGSPISSGRT